MPPYVGRRKSPPLALSKSGRGSEVNFPLSLPGQAPRFSYTFCFSQYSMPGQGMQRACLLVGNVLYCVCKKMGSHWLRGTRVRPKEPVRLVPTKGRYAGMRRPGDGWPLFCGKGERNERDTTGTVAAICRDRSQLAAPRREPENRGEDFAAKRRNLPAIAGKALHA